MLIGILAFQILYLWFGLVKRAATLEEKFFCKMQGIFALSIHMLALNLIP